MTDKSDYQARLHRMARIKKKPIREIRCKVKRSYSEKRYAKRAAKRASAKLRPYECPDCGNWHLTSQRSPSQKQEAVALSGDPANTAVHDDQ